MSEKNPFRVFVSHTFSSHPDYHRVFEYLESAPNFFYLNCSAPERPPAIGGKEALKDELRKQINAAEVVIVLSSLYTESQSWLLYQMDAAQALERPLIALGSFGTDEKLPPEIVKRAAELVDWNKRSIVDAIRRQARHEDTTRWDTIEFKMP